MSRIEKQDKKTNKDEFDLLDKLVGINRVAKVVKGGRLWFCGSRYVGDQEVSWLGRVRLKYQKL